MTSDNPYLDLPPLRKARKPIKPKPAPGKYDLRKLYYDARRIMYQRDMPIVWASGHYYDNTFPDISSTNGTTRYIEDVINNLGHHCERVNVTGFPMFRSDGSPLLGKDGKQKYRRSGSTKGSTDIHCEIKIPSQAFPCGWKIELKNKDTMLKGQEKYKAKMDRVGVLHSVVYVGDLDLFWEEYERIISL